MTDRAKPNPSAIDAADEREYEDIGELEVNLEELFSPGELEDWEKKRQEFLKRRALNEKRRWWKLSPEERRERRRRKYEKYGV